MKFSVVYKPTALFSLRNSNSTNSGAKSLFLPSPYAVKMAFLSQAISLGGIDFENNPRLFEIVRNVKISYFVKGNFCVNNCFVKIQKQRDNDPFRPTVSFREYVFLSDDIEIIFETETEKGGAFLKTYLHCINYFGKRGCFFQFVAYKEIPSEPNVKVFDPHDWSAGIMQEYDDFDQSLTFEKVNSYSEVKTRRNKQILVLPLVCYSASKSYTRYVCNGNSY